MSGRFRVVDLRFWFWGVAFKDLESNHHGISGATWEALLPSFVMLGRRRFRASSAFHFFRSFSSGAAQPLPFRASSSLISTSDQGLAREGGSGRGGREGREAGGGREGARTRLNHQDKAKARAASNSLC